MRLFIAINFSDAIKDKLYESVQKLSEQAVRGNFTRRENLHLTLAFIGETNKTAILMKAMGDVKVLPFTLTVSNTGIFRRTGGDIIWLGFEKSTALASIYEQLRSSLRNAGIQLDDREFTPHLTLGREAILPEHFDKAGILENVNDLQISIGNISLMKSERVNGQLRYTEIYKTNLLLRK